MDRFTMQAIAIVVFGVVLLLVGTRFWDHSISEDSCEAFGVASGRKTEFVDYTFWSWDCLTPTADGKKISTKALRDVAP